ncbi:cell wall-binding repeat-containing protein [Peptacetobacter hiranonis]|uniref:Putative cell wall binding repeat 2 n=1 Tax=Peptacetobacter hiranonis (strain DSM 13275 / JCM 10541 / KCTC 15199 / TO-931) TaxID=500633 RepID=B6FYH6_PEPHT|nr:cell wall-binding repeat-containing protein [Peptacetobacter hiranonis]EEA85421.1 putative cell wall binding repeat 2 [Peptacetobacter hiranonis DSM 13275]QEK20231.1 N-acetylmuramoyl-L-alanine amidase LytC [Peptacetobacter hiranonis]
MNKKKLSVVMAGAMLATSVAPVLAAETTEVKEYQLSDVVLLTREIKKLMEDNKVSTNKALIADKLDDSMAYTSGDTRFVKEAVGKAMLAGESVYGIIIYNADGTVAKDASNHSGTAGQPIYNITNAETDIKAMTAGQTLKVFKRDTTKFNDEVIPGTSIAVDDQTVATYAKTDLVTVGNALEETFKKEAALIATSKAKSAIVDETKIAINSKKDGVILTLRALDENGKNKTIELKEGDEKLDFQLAYDAEGNLLDATNPDEVQKFDHFGKKVNTYHTSTLLTSNTLEKTSYKVVADKANVETIKASDLYDGFALTSKGTELLSDLKNAAEKVDETIATANNALVKLKNADIVDDKSGIYYFEVEYKRATSNTTSEVYKTVKVTSTNKAELKSLFDLIKSGEFKVGIVAGQNRYETAVNVAKANGAELKIADKSSGTDKILNNNIVLVNGTSLVDGLAAAPLAASLNEVGTAKSDYLRQAPILLAKTDELPTETKEYIEERASHISKNDRKDYVVTLVGGESVLSEELVKEIKDMGFTVKRLGGDNREETSVAVAKKLTVGTDGIFVVGGNGEADAMSVSAVAASKKMPIIVSKVGSISRDALNYIEENASTSKVRVIGGEKVVSKADEEKINKVLSKTNAAYRIAGENRQATNAAIIKEYYKTGEITGTTGVVLVKDGVAKKDELIDALSAANYAASMKAPIVLASSNLSAAQEDAIVRVNGVAKVAQVGEGAARTVLETIAGLFGISNVK